MICSYQSFILLYDVKRCALVANTVATSLRGLGAIGPNPTLAAKTANVRFKQNQRARYVANLETRLLDNCSVPDDHIDPRRLALFMARSLLREIRDGGTDACSTA